MTAWRRATRVLECGGGQHDQPRYIAVDEPFLELTVRLASGNTLTFVRCQTCEGPPPPDLPAGVVRHTSVEETSMFTAAQDTFARIYRRRLERTIPLLVEREPGEEG